MVKCRICLKDFLNKIRGEIKMRKLSTLRVPRNYWLKEKNFENFKIFLNKFKDSIDRVALFCPDCHTR